MYHLSQGWEFEFNRNRIICFFYKIRVIPLIISNGILSPLLHTVQGIILPENTTQTPQNSSERLWLLLVDPDLIQTR